MKFAVALALAVGVSASANASILNYAFSGTVDDGTYANAPVDTSYVPGQTIAGSFQFDTATDTFTSFTIGGYTAPAATTIYSPPLTSTTFAYLGVEATDPVTSGVTAELALDFYYEPPASASTANIASFIQNPGAFSTDLAGGSPSQFNVFLDNGGTITSVGALLTTYGVPEPASIALLGTAFAGLALVRRRSV